MAGDETKAMADLAQKMGSAVEAMTVMMKQMKEEAVETKRLQEESMKVMMEKMTEKKGGRGDGPKGQVDVTTLKTFTDLPKLDGRPENFDNWRFKMYQFLTKDKNYIEVLGWIEENKIDVTKESLNNFDIELLDGKIEDLQWYNSQLWSVLSSNCIDEALGQIKNLESDTDLRGFRAWYKVTQDF